MVGAAAVAAFAAAAPSAVAQSPSDACTAPNATIADGHFAGTYVRFRAQRNSDGTTLVCYRVDNGTTLDDGGQLRIAAPSAGVVGAPSNDDQGNACSTTPGNVAPGPHPLVDAEVGDPNAPPHVPVKLDTFSNTSGTWVCLVAGTVKRRIVLPGVLIQAPDLKLTKDPTPQTPPGPRPGPLGYASSSCTDEASDRGSWLVNGQVDRSHLWVSTAQETSTSRSICVRSEGAYNGGGRLTVDTATVDAVPPQVAVKDDVTPCSIQVLRIGGGVPLTISRTPTDANPVSVCVQQGSTSKRFEIRGAAVSSNPKVMWNGDPEGPVKGDIGTHSPDNIGEIGQNAVGSYVAESAGGIVVIGNGRAANVISLSTVYSPTEAEWTRVTDDTGIVSTTPRCVPENAKSVLCIADEKIDVRAGDGDDIVYDSAYNSYGRVEGGAGNDRLTVAGYSGQALGGTGNDVITASANTTADGGDGNDALTAYNWYGSPVRGGAGDDSVRGGWYQDWLYGDAGVDTVDGDYGNDSVDGGLGADILRGGAGADQLSAADGFRDDLLCGTEADTAYADALDVAAADCETVNRS